MASVAPLSVDSRYALLEEWWRQSVETGPTPDACRAFVLSLARTMGDEEVLWLPAERFADQREALAYLEHQQVLVRDAAGTRIAFAHQSFFDFCRARAFVTGREGLAAHVKKQDYSLFTRPLVVATLGYLRGADPKRYRQELIKLVSDEAMRPHLSNLVLHFLGQVADPEPEEQRLALAALTGSPRRRKVMLSSMIGSEAWLRVLDPHLPTLMREEPDLAGALLKAAVKFAPTKVADLIRTYWLPLQSEHERVAWFLSALDSWGPDELRVAEQLLRSKLSENVAQVLISHAIRRGGRAGLELLLKDLQDRLAICLKEIPPPSSLPTASTEEEQLRWAMNREPKESLERLLSEVSQLPALRIAAESSPAEFTNVIWGWFNDVLEANAEPETDRMTFRREYLYETSPEEPHTLGGLFSKAVEAFAATDPNGFTAFLARWESSSIETVHQHLIAGLQAGLPELADLAASYLGGDPRRLHVGWANPGENTLTLLRAIAPLLNAGATADLVQKIMESSHRNEHEGTAERRRARLAYNRRHRARLLDALRAAPLKASVRANLQPEVHAEAEDEASFTRVREVGSHVTTEQVAKMRDRDILSLFSTLPDSTEFTHPKRFLSGGSVQVSRVLASVIKARPEYRARDIKLLKKFAPSTHQRPVALGFEALIEGGLGLPAAEVLLAELDRLGFGSAEFRTTVAYALEKLANGEVAASTSTIGLLASWLTEATEIESPRTSDERDRPILWGGGGGSLPWGNYPILSALSVLLLVRPQPDFDTWVDLLLKHLERRESPRVWEALSYQLRFVSRASDGRGFEFVTRLFEKFPSLLASGAGVRLIGITSQWIPERQVQLWLDGVRGTGWARANQAYGELVGLIATREDAPEWASDAMRSILAADADAETRRGLVVVAARLWEDPVRRIRATDALVAACAFADERGAYDQIMRVFDVSESIAWDASTKAIVRALLDNQRVLSGHSFKFADQLEPLLVVDPSQIVPLLAAYVAQQTNPGGDQSRDLFSSGPKLVELALTVQRLGDDYKSTGLDLFGQLLDVGCYGSADALKEIDAREY